MHRTDLLGESLESHAILQATSVSTPGDGKEGNVRVDIDIDVHMTPVPDFSSSDVAKMIG
jgi:hypothetical protein